VSHLFVEESPSEVKASSAENVLSNL
jgi:peroxiredoxin